MEVITKEVFAVLNLCRSRLHDEIAYHVYSNGKGSPGSPSRILRTYGIINKSKRKLLKEVTVYLNTVEVI